MGEMDPRVTYAHEAVGAVGEQAGDVATAFIFVPRPGET